MVQQAREVFAVDIGQVLVEQFIPEFHFHGKHYLSAPELPDAFRVLRRLHSERGMEITLATRCASPRLRSRRTEWLDHHDFWQRVGIPRVAPLYCWTPHYKSSIFFDCGITHAIDDDPDELLHLDLVPVLLLFRGRPDAIERNKSFINSRVTCTQSWLEVENLMLSAPTPV
jgi:hypothetical protein